MSTLLLTIYNKYNIIISEGNYVHNNGGKKDMSKEKKIVIISTDVGFNGIKTVVGNQEEQLFKFHTSSDICEITNVTSVGASKEDKEALYIKEETDTTKKLFITGSTAKFYLTIGDNIEAAKDDNFYTAGEEEDDYKRFLSDKFKMLHLSVIYNVLKRLEEIDGYTNICTEPEKFQLIIHVDLPFIIANDSKYQDKINGYLKADNNTLYFSQGIGNYEQLNGIIRQAEVNFGAQVLSAVIGELDTHNDDNEMVPPVFALDCGGKTIGIAAIERNNQLAKGGESNRDYAITNINIAVAEEVKSLTEGAFAPDPDQVERMASKEDNNKGIYNYADKDYNQHKIDIAAIYDKKLQETAIALVKYCFENHGASIGRSNTILVAGGAGEAYFKYVESEFRKKVLSSTKIILASGEVGDDVNGSIYAVATGGFKIELLRLIAA